MKAAKRVVIVVVALGCAFGALWVFRGPAANGVIVGNANVVGGIAGLAGLLAAAAAAWPKVARRTSGDPVAADQVQAAADYLAGETLRYWRVQAKDRRITTPSPATVRWGWASDDVAVSAQELQPQIQVLTAGVVTQLREQIYDHLSADQARIVLLGKAGAGKTAAMLLLVIDILKNRADGSRDPVPVWLTLGGWNPNTTSLQDWAAATLSRDYPGLAATAHGGRGAVAELIRTGRIALFLDGLDEMPPGVQGAALQAIDRDAAGLRVVLTSRPGQYRSAVTQGRLYRAAVIELLPVGVDQAQTFLLAEQLGARRSEWQHVIDHLRAHPDSVAARTLTTPLALSLARDTYTIGNPANLFDTNRHPTPDTLLQHLLARSLTFAYPDPAEREYATQWLSWIALRMGVDRDLRWWDIPAWTRRWQRGLVMGLLIGLAFGLLIGLAIGLEVGPAFGLVFGLEAGLMLGLLGGLLVGLGSEEPRRIAVRSPTRRELHRLLLLGLGCVALGLAGGLVVGLAGGLLFGLVVGLAGVPMNMWSTPLTTQAASSMAVYRADRRRTLVIELVFGLVFGLWGGLGGGPVFGVVIGLFFGLVVGLFFGRGPAVQLAIVEMIWGLQLRRVRFMPLLQTALHRQVLRQAGTVYQFRHAALQDLLATRKLPASATDIAGIQQGHSP